jgi:PAS domain S-box-containing protein
MLTEKNPILSPEQTNLIFDNMSDGVILVDENETISYINSAGASLFHMTQEEALGASFSELFLQNKKNRAFNKLFHLNMEKGQSTDKTVVRYHWEGREFSYLSVDVSLIQRENTSLRRKEPFQGMLILIEDVTDTRLLKQHDHDCAYIFTGLICCISLYLATWSLCRFTLHIPLGTKHYTLMIEAITFLLFLEIAFCTSFSLREIGLIPNLSRLKKNFLETLSVGSIACVVILLTKVVLGLIGIKIKGYFIGGSLHGAYIYVFTAFAQEFLARGVIQTSVKSLLHIRYQKPLCILLTSLLFSLMHLPFGFYFMAGAFLLSIALGIIFERQRDIWGCALLHWGCGYLAMCLFF